MRLPLAVLVFISAASGAFAQGGPPPLQPLQPPNAPPQNQPTFAKTQLGRVLFWDEQLSASRTMACGTCHFSTHGGSDPRSLQTNAASSHPGLDGLFGTPDDVTGSMGVQRALANGDLTPSAFGLAPQVTSRKAPSTLTAAYAQRLFWDGLYRVRFFGHPSRGNQAATSPPFSICLTALGALCPCFSISQFSL